MSRSSRSPAPFVVALALLLGGPLACLDEPVGLDCIDAPPDTPGCAADRGVDGRAAPPDMARDGEPDGAEGDARAEPADGRAPDGRVVDARPADWAADGGPLPDAGLDGGPMPDAEVDRGPAPCAVEACPEPPVQTACLDTTIARIEDPACGPAACDADAVACDPATLACRAHVGCLFWCLLVENREDCAATCAARHLPPDAEGTRRFETLDACLEPLGCPIGPDGEACRRESCAAELDACLGEGAPLWFLRPPRPGSAITCDYPVATGENCAERALACRQGACVDADGPCAPDPCRERPPLACDDDTLVETAPPVCSVVDGTAVCEYEEVRTRCEADPPRCAGDVLLTDGDPRCVEDVQGVYCDADEVRTDCSAGAPAAYCRGNDVVAITPGTCAAEGGQAECTAHTEESRPCAAPELCHAGDCIASDCPPRCEDRDLVGCTGRQEEIRVRCTREQRCTVTGCRGFPDVYGTACRSGNDRTACEAAGLVCRGDAAIPFCLLGETPRSGRQTCWTTDDCEPGTLCTRQGRCSAGRVGDPCEDQLDCQGFFRCQRGVCR